MSDLDTSLSENMFQNLQNISPIPDAEPDGLELVDRKPKVEHLLHKQAPPPKTNREPRKRYAAAIAQLQSPTPMEAALSARFRSPAPAVVPPRMRAPVPVRGPLPAGTPAVPTTYLISRPSGKPGPSKTYQVVSVTGDANAGEVMKLVPVGAQLKQNAAGQQQKKVVYAKAHPLPNAVRVKEESASLENVLSVPSPVEVRKTTTTTLPTSSEKNQTPLEGLMAQPSPSDVKVTVPKVEAPLGSQPLNIDNFLKMPSPKALGTGEEMKKEMFVHSTGRVKRPMNAFMIWGRKARAEVSRTLGSGASNGDVSVKMGELWRAMTDEEKEPYYREARQLAFYHSNLFPHYEYKPEQHDKQFGPLVHKKRETSSLWKRFSSSGTLDDMSAGMVKNLPQEKFAIPPHKRAKRDQPQGEPSSRKRSTYWDNFRRYGTVEGFPSVSAPKAGSLAAKFDDPDLEDLLPLTTMTPSSILNLGQFFDDEDDFPTMVPLRRGMDFRSGSPIHNALLKTDPDFNADPSFGEANLINTDPGPVPVSIIRVKREPEDWTLLAPKEERMEQGEQHEADATPTLSPSRVKEEESESGGSGFPGVADPGVPGGAYPGVLGGAGDAGMVKVKDEPLFDDDDVNYNDNDNVKVREEWEDSETEAWNDEPITFATTKKEEIQDYYVDEFRSLDTPPVPESSPVPHTIEEPCPPVPYPVPGGPGKWGASTPNDPSDENAHGPSILRGRGRPRKKKFTTSTQIADFNPKFAVACCRCGRGFETNAELAAHMPLHGEFRAEKRAVCPRCRKTFPDQDSLNAHQAVACFDEVPYFCDVCTKTFTDSHNLMLHKREHSSNIQASDPYACLHCEAAFRSRSALLRHVRFHTGERPYVCSICRATFPTQDDLWSHKSKAHPNEGSQGEGDAVYACQFCPGEFTSLEDFRRHSVSHTGLTPFKCSQCGSQFSKSDQLNDHMETHKND